MSFFNPSDVNSFNQGFRKKRFNFFINLLRGNYKNKKINILDIGGTQSYWLNMGLPDDLDIHVLLLNLHLESVTDPRFTSIVGDATNLKEFANDSFDVVYSNSVIEHLFSWENQVKMAEEVKRVGKCYFVQTPNYYFPIEPHWLFPFFQFLPRFIKIHLTNNFSLGHYKKTQNLEQAIQRVEEVKLLTSKEMKHLFQDGNLYQERFLGLVKSISQYRFIG